MKLSRIEILNLQKGIEAASNYNYTDDNIITSLVFNADTIDLQVEAINKLEKVIFDKYKIVGIPDKSSSKEEIEHIPTINQNKFFQEQELMLNKQIEVNGLYKLNFKTLKPVIYNKDSKGETIEKQINLSPSIIKKLKPLIIFKDLTINNNEDEK